MSGIVVLISGRGSNLAAMCNANLAKQIKGVISNKADAPGLDIAKQFNIPYYIIEHKQYATREEFDRQMAEVIDKHNPQYIILAGFMRILSSWFVSRYCMRLINIHPSILPAFIGTNAISQAFAVKVKVTGVTVHFVTDKLDHGPIIAQGIIPAAGCTTGEELENLVHQLEHVIYPFIISKLISGKITFDLNEVVMVAKEDSDVKCLGRFNNYIFY